MQLKRIGNNVERENSKTIYTIWTFLRSTIQNFINMYPTVWAFNYSRLKLNYLKTFLNSPGKLNVVYDLNESFLIVLN